MYLFFIACMLFLFLRLATGSGYENFRSLAPVMTPQIGSWHSWYQSLSLELYNLGRVIVGWLCFLLNYYSIIRFRHVFDQSSLFEYSA